MPFSFESDRFDKIPKRSKRFGAHRSQFHYIQKRFVVLFASFAIVLFTAGGIVSMAVINGNISFSSSSSLQPSASVPPSITPDPGLEVFLLEGIGVAGEADRVSAQLRELGWTIKEVAPSEQQDEHNVVFYLNEDHKQQAELLAQSLPDSRVVFSSDLSYLDADLVVVL